MADGGDFCPTDVFRILTITDDGIFAASQDKGVKFVRDAQPYYLTSKLREPLSNLLADDLPTYCEPTVSQSVVVYRILGECETTQGDHHRLATTLRWRGGTQLGIQERIYEGSGLHCHET